MKKPLETAGTPPFSRELSPAGPIHAQASPMHCQYPVRNTSDGKCGRPVSGKKLECNLHEGMVYPRRAEQNRVNTANWRREHRWRSHKIAADGRAVTRMIKGHRLRYPDDPCCWHCARTLEHWHRLLDTFAFQTCPILSALTYSSELIMHGRFAYSGWLETARAAASPHESVPIDEVDKTLLAAAEIAYGYDLVNSIAAAEGRRVDSLTVAEGYQLSLRQHHNALFIHMNDDHCNAALNNMIKRMRKAGIPNEFCVPDLTHDWFDRLIVNRCDHKPGWNLSRVPRSDKPCSCIEDAQFYRAARICTKWPILLDQYLDCILLHVPNQEGRCSVVYRARTLKRVPTLDCHSPLSLMSRIHVDRSRAGQPASRESVVKSTPVVVFTRGRYGGPKLMPYEQMNTAELRRVECIQPGVHPDVLEEQTEFRIQDGPAFSPCEDRIIGRRLGSLKVVEHVRI